MGSSFVRPPRQEYFSGDTLEKCVRISNGTVFVGKNRSNHKNETCALMKFKHFLHASFWRVFLPRWAKQKCNWGSSSLCLKKNLNALKKVLRES